MGESTSRKIVSKESSNQDFASYDSATRDSSLSTPSTMEESVEEDLVHKPEVEAAVRMSLLQNTYLGLKGCLGLYSRHLHVGPFRLH
jgi:hypothetical protein